MRATVFAWLVLGAVGLVPATAAGAEEPDFPGWIESLGVADAATRQSAERRLRSAARTWFREYAAARDGADRAATTEPRQRLLVLGDALRRGEASENPLRREGATRIRESLRLRARVAVVFVSGEDGDPDLIALDRSGTLLRRLTSNVDRDDGPVFSPDGERLAYRSDHGGRADIHVMDVDGANDVRLSDPAHGDHAPAWSPDGRRLAYMSARSGGCEIRVMDARSGGSVRLTRQPGDDYAPVWSPDGKRIAFITRRFGDLEIASVSSGGGDFRRLTDAPGDDRDPVFSPDGRRIAFVSKRDGDLDVYVMRADGSDPVCVTRNEGWDMYPTWSPDGRRLAYASSVRTKRGDAGRISVVDANTLAGGPVGTPRDFECLRYLRFDRSGRVLLFERCRELCPRHEIRVCLLDLADGSERVLHEERGRTCCPSRPVWQPVPLPELADLFAP